MLNYRSKPRQDEIFIKIAIWGTNLVLNGSPKFGQPWGSRGISFYVGGKGRQWTQSHRKSQNSISHSMVIWVQEPDAMLNHKGCVMSFRKLTCPAQHVNTFVLISTKTSKKIASVVFIICKHSQKYAELSYLSRTSKLWFYELHCNNTVWPFISYELCSKLDFKRQPNLPTVSKKYFQRKTSSDLSTTS